LRPRRQIGIGLGILCAIVHWVLETPDAAVRFRTPLPSRREHARRICWK
jgi:hypothetical protein